LAVVFVVLLVVCVVQLKLAVESYATAHLGLTTLTAAEMASLDWLLRKSTLASVYVVPALLFFALYLSTWRRGAASAPSDAAPGQASFTSRLRLVAAISGCITAALLLLPARATRLERVELKGLQKIARLNPSVLNAHLNLAYNQEQQGRLGEALTEYRATLQLWPDSVAARVGEGNILLRQGDNDAAVACYHEVLDIQPRHEMARYNLGTAYLNLGEFDHAFRSFEEVVRANPDDARALRSLGQSLIGLERGCDALVHLRRSLSLDPSLAAQGHLRDQVRELSARCGPH
jgi:tetratricopeptide (TPR) repeat protein